MVQKSLYNNFITTKIKFTKFTHENFDDHNFKKVTCLRKNCH